MSMRIKMFRRRLAFERQRITMLTPQQLLNPGLGLWLRRHRELSAALEEMHQRERIEHLVEMLNSGVCPIHGADCPELKQERTESTLQ